MAKIIEKIQLQLNGPSLKVKNNQHAFTKSTVSALISITQKWYDATDNSLSGRKGVHAVFRGPFVTARSPTVLFFCISTRQFLSKLQQQKLPLIQTTSE